VVGQTITNECKLVQFLGEKDNIISINEIITPDWCPLKKEDFTIKFEDLSEAKDNMALIQKKIDELKEHVSMLNSGKYLQDMYDAIAKLDEGNKD
jgi:hypothetical protein